jgi:hypothetical protein
LTPSVRVNAFNMHTKTAGTNDGNNYSAAAIQKSFWGRSYAKAGFLNRQGFSKFEPSQTDYGRNLMFLTSLRSKDNKWEVWGEGHHAFKRGVTKDNNYASTGFQYSSNNWSVLQDFTHIGTNYYADMGNLNRIDNYDAVRDTTVRLGFTHSFTQIDYALRPKNSEVAEHAAGIENYMVWNPNGSLNEWFNRFRYFLTFRNTSSVQIRIDRTNVDVPFPFSFSDNNALIFGKYNYTYSSVDFQSDNRKALSGTFRYTSGEFYNGSQIGLSASATYRIQPWGRFSLKMNWNRIKLPPNDPSVSGVTKLLLISPKSEISFNRNVHWTTFFQFNTQSNNFNINSRLQWRFRPMSDFFLVYTDNYFADDERDSARNLLYSRFDKKSRALVCKLTYWLNL